VQLLGPVDTYELSTTESELLAECCRLLDEVELLRVAIHRDGVTVAGASGHTRTHPALAEVRGHRLALGKLLSQLGLPDVEGDALASPCRPVAAPPPLSDGVRPVARRKQVRADDMPDDGTLVDAAPAEFMRMENWEATGEFAAAQRVWLREHGVEPGHWSAVYPITIASHRAHAKCVRDLCALDRLRRKCEGTGPEDTARPK